MDVSTDSNKRSSRMRSHDLFRVVNMSRDEDSTPNGPPGTGRLRSVGAQLQACRERCAQTSAMSPADLAGSEKTMSDKEQGPLHQYKVRGGPRWSW